MTILVTVETLRGSKRGESTEEREGFAQKRRDFPVHLLDWTYGNCENDAPNYTFDTAYPYDEFSVLLPFNTPWRLYKMSTRFLLDTSLSDYFAHSLYGHIRVG